MTEFKHIPEWGLALFGKKDGFQIFWASSLCQYFRQTDSWNKIVSLIQLPQESLRLAPGQELVGMSRIVIREEPFWLYTRYQYALDQYKRDGYKASLLACRQSICEGEMAWQLLSEMMKTGREQLHPEELLQVLSATDFRTEPFPPELSANWGIYYLGEREDVSLAAFWDAAATGTLGNHERIMATQQAAVFNTLEEEVFQVLLGPEELKKEAERVSHDSLVYAYEQGDSGMWQKNGHTTNAHIQQKEGWLSRLGKWFGS